MSAAYPATAAARDRWILARRTERPAADSRRPHAYFSELERAPSGEIVEGSVLLLTNRECPWRCLMCDLWKHTVTETVPTGAIPAQIDFALSRLPPTRQIKLYNSGSFFDPRAIPVADHAAIAARVRHFERVIVESHPALIGDAAPRFHDRFAGALEVAMGLETACPEVLERLNKRMTLDQFRCAAEVLRRHGIALRVFVLLRPPFQQEDEALHWACRSVDFAFDLGAAVVCLIPTRSGNGALEALARRGEFAPPKLRTLEAALDYGVSLGRGRVFADLWDLTRLPSCPECSPSRRERLRETNLAQRLRPTIACAHCLGE